MAAPRAAKRAKKVKKVTGAQLLKASESGPRRAKGIQCVQLDGPLACLVPVERSDLFVGQETWEYPYWWSSLTYRLTRVENGIHYYEHEATT